MIRLANQEDIKAIMKIVGLVVADMKREGNHQWNEAYPVSDDFLKDVRLKNLYVKENTGGKVTGFICIDQIEPKAYEELMWSSNHSFLVIHRLAVSSDHRGQGIAREMIAYAENMARKGHIDYIRTDTYSKNKGMNALFSKLNYHFVGEINMLEKPCPFRCYEKGIVGEA